MRPGDDPSLLNGCTRAGLVVTRSQLELWAGRPLSSAELADLADAVPHSAIPELIASLVSRPGDQRI